MMKKLSVCGKKIVDETGAEVILNGINLVCKEKSLGYVTPCDESLFDWFASKGFNVLRLGLSWDGVEPQPMQYDDVYLAKIAKQVEWAGKRGIYIFLDMHQDLFSILYGNGAPPFATLSEGLPHITGEVWSDAYLISPAVNVAIDNFWINAPADDGIGVQDHYAKMWGHVAEFFNSYDNIIGYDIMNEPFMGSQSEKVLNAIISTYATSVMHIENPNPQELSELWFSDEKKQEVLSGMADMEIYKNVLTGAEPVSTHFETTMLTPFYNRVATEIRKINKEKILFLESNYFCNMAVESGFLPVTDSNGIHDPQQLYAPHGYDLVVDTDHYDIYNQPRVDLIFDTHKKVQQRLNFPVLVGEWGAFSNHESNYNLAVNINRIFEKHLWSNTFWCYYKGIEEHSYVKALNRGYPMLTDGELHSYYYDYDERKLTVWVTATNNQFEIIVYHPFAENATVLVNGKSAQAKQLKYGRLKISLTNTGKSEIVVIGKI